MNRRFVEDIFVEPYRLVESAQGITVLVCDTVFRMHRPAVDGPSLAVVEKYILLSQPKCNPIYSTELPQE